MAEDKSQKTEKPTDRKRKEARKEGQIARTAELAAWLSLLAAVFLAKMTFSMSIEVCRETFTQFGSVIEAPDTAKALHLLMSGLMGAAKALAPLVLGIMVIGLASGIAQGGLRPSAKLIKPKWSKLNPLKGIKRVFGTHGLWEAGKALGKTAILGLLLYQTVMSVRPLMHSGTVMPLDYVVSTTGKAISDFALHASIAGLVMAVADYAVQFRRTRKQMMMTKQEVKQEHKNTEGDPQLKGAIRSRQMSMRRNRMIADIANADVVLVNPTHVAVALKYDAAKGAPRVVAKGAGAIAARIRAEATDKRIPMVEDVPLARTLYRVCELGQEIPGELFTAVARILAFVYGLKARGSAAGIHHRPATSAEELKNVTRRRRPKRRSANAPRRNSSRPARSSSSRIPA